SAQSSLPHVKFPLAPDKLAHGSVYFVLTWFGWRAFHFQSWSVFLRRNALVLAFFFTCVYGVTDEIHQIYVPGRTFDLSDMLADAIGAALFLPTYWMFLRRMATRPEVPSSVN
ncbi:MAG: VanZ family protein, partial [Ignavibacteriales bacterium]|nr:VanZ family protein [Ignavibacteriales bacterium]